MLHTRSTVSAIALALLVTGCGGGGGSSGGGTVVAPTPSPSTGTPSPSPSTPAPSPSSSPLPTTWAGVAGYYDVQPDIGGCRAGTLKDAVKTEFLARLNDIRARHGLAPVVYSTDEDVQQAESSLMMAANVALSHTPPTSWRCYTAGGSTAAV